VLLLWITAIVLLWMLASTRNANRWQPNSGAGRLVLASEKAQSCLLRISKQHVRAL
jgi:hypothetical protein